MPKGDIQLIPRENIMSFEEIVEVVRIAVKLGIDKFRLTGGEPLLREGVVDLVAMISSLEGVNDLAMTTNGILLGKYAARLKQAGLKRVNISLDTVDAKKFSQITLGGKLEDVLAGITAARENKLEPIKINCVVNNSSAEDDARDVAAFCSKNRLEVRFIRKMDLREGKFAAVEGGSGGVCAKCNRLRLTSDGMIRPCLFDEQQFSVREMGAEQALLSALSLKPLAGKLNRKSKFYSIGG
jgi:cyclic pyranopterin phosphate synthase